MTRVQRAQRVQRVQQRSGAGPLLREWRQRRRLSQLELSNRAAVSTRHLSYLETGRSRPSREMLLHLSEELDVPLAERNTLLVAAGFAPVYRETPVDAPEMAAVRRALEGVLRGHEPYPAMVVNRASELVMANDALGVLVEEVDPALLEPPVNVMRVALHPRGVAPRVVNFDEYAAHLLGRLRREVERTADETLAALLEEVRSYPGVPAEGPEVEGDVAEVAAREAVLPMVVRRAGGSGPGGGPGAGPGEGPEELSFFSTIATFGTPVDITLADLSIEAFFPADDATAKALRARS